MKVEERSAQNSNRVLVNRLIEEVFGSGWRGDYNPAYEPGIFDAAYKLIDRPCFIGRKSRGLLMSNFEIAGQVGAEMGDISDGSIIRVFPKYRDFGKRYAELYEKQMGREAIVIVTTKPVLVTQDMRD